MILLNFCYFGKFYKMFFEFAIIGPTASGKSDLANTIASKYNAIVLSLDSLCVYKEINIASAKPDIKGFEYFGINLLSIEQNFNVGLFFDEYKKAKSIAMKNNKILIIVGGTSFYLMALLNGLSAKIIESKSKLNNDEIYQLVIKIDKNAKIAINDSYRLKKWLSIYENTKQIPSEFLKQTLQKPLIKNIKIFELNIDKNVLIQNIENRTKKMLKIGLIEEAKWLFDNYDNNLKALNSIGLKECKEYLNKQINIKELEHLINTHTAQLAKRQKTFNKKFNKTILDPNKALSTIENRLKSRLV